MLENLKDAQFNYQKLTPQEMKERGILGRLVGNCADFLKPTRNGRLYSEELWEKVFNNPIMKEKFKNKVMFGELCHPEGRLEVDPEKVAISMSEPPKKGKDGKLKAVFDILDTPNGRILKTFCDYGSTLGISSRGDGDVLEDAYSDTASVDPDTYNCECWDVVFVPGVEDARLTYMKESLNTKPDLKQALKEELEKADPNSKKVMKETLDELNIEYTPEKVIDKKSDIAANDIGATTVKALQESLLKQQTQETQITELQEKLSVCYAKEAKYEEDVAKYKNAIRNLSESVNNAKALQTRLDALTEQLKAKDLAISKEKASNSRVLEKHEAGIERQKVLTESVSVKTAEISKLTKQVNLLTEELTDTKTSYEANINELREELIETKKNLDIKASEYKNKLTNSNSLVEKYRTTARNAVDKYIESKAVMFGLNSNEIKNKLPSNYSFNDIDSICEKLSDFNLKINSLPISLTTSSKAVITESKNNILPKNRFDDSIDESLYKMAGLND